MIKNSWTNKNLVADAKKHKRRSEWQEKSGAAYLAAYKKGNPFFENCCNHMEVLRNRWTDEKLLEDAKKYKRRSEWEEKSKAAYQAAWRRGKTFHENCCNHMEVLRNRWTDEKLLASAKKYQRRREWQLQSGAAYAAAFRRGKPLFEKCCQHMRKSGYPKQKEKNNLFTT